MKTFNYFNLVAAFLWRSRTGLRSSDKVLWRIFALAWESTLLPAISMLLAIGLYHHKVSVCHSMALSLPVDCDIPIDEGKPNGYIFPHFDQQTIYPMSVANDQ